MATEIIGADTARWRELDARDRVHPLSDQDALTAKVLLLLPDFPAAPMRQGAAMENMEQGGCCFTLCSVSCGLF